eukprot:scaffold1661_cov251-Pinguiococcus_pyrenoidosus.AAC.47
MACHERKQDQHQSATSPNLSVTLNAFLRLCKRRSRCIGIGSRGQANCTVPRGGLGGTTAQGLWAQQPPRALDPETGAGRSLRGRLDKSLGCRGGLAGIRVFSSSKMRTGLVRLP